MSKKQRRLIHAAMYMDRLVDRLRFKVDRIPYNHPDRENHPDFQAWSIAHGLRGECWSTAGISWIGARFEFTDY